MRTALTFIVRAVGTLALIMASVISRIVMLGLFS
jgi:hypothetical protein